MRTLQDHIRESLRINKDYDYDSIRRRQVHSTDEIIEYSRKQLDVVQNGVLDLSDINLTDWDDTHCITFKALADDLRYGVKVIDVSNWKFNNSGNVFYDFFTCFKKLSKIEEIRGIDTWQVLYCNIEAMFTGCENLRGTIDIRNLRPSNSVVSLSRLFSECRNVEKIILPKYDMNVTDAEFMFYECKRLKKINNLMNIRNDHGDLKSTLAMFASCSSLRDVHQLYKLDLSSVTNSSYMFSECNKLHLDDSILDRWVLPPGCNDEHMFDGTNQKFNRLERKW